jgi:hypothetical protein
MSRPWKKFHVTKNPAGGAVDFIVAIGTPVERRTTYPGPKGCKCEYVYPVEMKSLGEDVPQEAHRDGKRHVCDCLGEIIV